MATNLALDDALIEEAKRVGHHKTKKDAVTAALTAYVEHHRRLKILDLAGDIDFDPSYNYKAGRKKR